MLVLLAEREQWFLHEHTRIGGDGVKHSYRGVRFRLTYFST
jgi:hypothetical protein